MKNRETKLDEAAAKGEAQTAESVDGNAAVELLARERDELKDQLLRSLADLQNFRRRAQQEKEELRKFATESLVRQLIPVLDNFERTIGAIESGASKEAVLEGVRAVDRQLRSALEAVKLEKINALGSLFDPEHHEAITTEHSEEHPDDTVIEEIEPGYKMADRVVRPARVKVAKRR